MGREYINVTGKGIHTGSQEMLDQVLEVLGEGFTIDEGYEYRPVTFNQIDEQVARSSSIYDDHSIVFVRDGDRYLISVLLRAYHCMMIAAKLLSNGWVMSNSGFVEWKSSAGILMHKKVESTEVNREYQFVGPIVGFMDKDGWTTLEESESNHKVHSLAMSFLSSGWRMSNGGHVRLSSGRVVYLMYRKV